jgi:tetratricopeptide (TPR) repeat protein
VQPFFQISDRPDEALQSLQKALRISLLTDGEFPCRVSIARIYERIGNILSSRGDSVAAVEQYELALGVYSRAGKSDDSKEMTSLNRKIFDAVV